ncbi:MAG: DNA starvation/stationary phase protection protein [Melioribacteraceae bacterium]|nr:DNA starvation/stationary phase protection protein [Melioribacteraceae bacterium]
MNKNKIGLTNQNAEVLSDSLNRLLADYQIYYQNLRGLHWNIKGKQFFTLHSKFEGFYNEAAETIDEIAERILMLGSVPYHSFEDYTNNAKLKAVKNVTEGEESVKVVLNNMQSILDSAREIFKKAGDIDEEGTASMMSDLISYHEKNIWMLSAWLGE